MYQMIEALIICLFLIIAVVMLGAIGGIIDNYLDPHCNCHEINRQKRENGGVRL